VFAHTVCQQRAQEAQSAALQAEHVRWQHADSRAALQQPAVACSSLQGGDVTKTDSTRPQIIGFDI